MASLEKRYDGTYRLIFVYRNQKHSFTIGRVSAEDAQAHKADAEMRLRLLKQNLIDLNGHTIEKYLLHRGHPPEGQDETQKRSYTLGRLREQYLKSAAAKLLEKDTFRIAGYHFSHLTRLLGREQELDCLELRDLQMYIDRRAKENSYRGQQEGRAKDIHPETIRKEIKTLRTAWNWARHMEGLEALWPAPGRYLVYPKVDEPYPFMTLEEARRKQSSVSSPERLFDAIYILPNETEELLGYVQTRGLASWLYPMFVCAAHTGARRSELLRAHTADVDLVQGVLTIHEKKRKVGKRTTRFVPLTPLLRSVLLPLLGSDGPLFRGTQKGTHLESSTVRDYFHKALQGSKWEELRGWHVFRHSFISALASKGVDQRIIDELVGHSTEEQRRRYRHLFPDVKHQAVLTIFGAKP